MDEKKLQELFSDEAFVNSLLEMDTAQGVQAALNEKGVVLTLEEIEVYRQLIVSKNGEMSEQDLGSVAGGFRTIDGIRVYPGRPRPRW